VHVPFCRRRCPYCDFDIAVGRVPAIDTVLEGLARELAARGDELAALQPTTLYLGGGTPSLVGAAGLAAIRALLDPFVDRTRIVEATVELNPEDVDAALVQGLVEIGFDRVSLGVQTLAEAGLRELGRCHDAAQARAAIAQCVDAGLRTSVDVIVGWPGQRDEDLEADLAAILGAGIEHVSVYALTIEAGAPWPTLVRRGLRVVPDDDRQAELLVRAEARLHAAGLEHYEVASYARPGAQARHNLGYWTWRDYVGLGPSAGSARFGADGTVVRRSNPRGLAAWIEAAAPEIETLAGEAAAAEGLWLGLRRLSGMHVPAWLARFPSVDAAWLRHRIGPALARGDLQWDEGGGTLRVAAGAPETPAWLRHDAIAAALL